MERNHHAAHEDTYDNTVVLVTGGAGSIGVNLVRALAEAGAYVIILDDLSSAPGLNLESCQSTHFLQGSVGDKAVLTQAFSHRPKIVFHLAALFANQNSVDHPEQDLAVNGLGTLRLLQFADAYSVQRVVYASSCAVYGHSTPLPLREDEVRLEPRTPYQITKFLGELYGTYFHYRYGLDIAIARLFSSYGPGELPGNYRNVIPNFIYRAVKGLPLRITGTGAETRDFTYVGDVVEALLLAGRRPQARGGTFNIGTGRETRIIDLAKMINDAVENPSGVRFVQRRSWDHATRRLASVDRAASVLGYKPAISLEDGLAETIKWFRNNWGLIEGAEAARSGCS